MDKCRVVIYDCYVPLNEDARLLHLAKIQEMENEIGEYPEYEIVGKFHDDCSATTPLMERPEYQKLMAMAEERKFDMVASTSMKYFSRSIEDTLSAIKTYRDLGITLKCPSDNFDSNHIEMVENMNSIKNYGMEFDDVCDEEQNQDEGMCLQ